MMSSASQSPDVPAFEDLHLCGNVFVMTHILTNLTQIVLAPGEHLSFSADASSMAFTKAQGCPLANNL